MKLKSVRAEKGQYVIFNQSGEHFAFVYNIAPRKWLIHDYNTNKKYFFKNKKSCMAKLEELYDIEWV